MSTPRQLPQRRGNTYLMVLGVVTLLSVTVIAGVTVLRAHRAGLSIDQDIVRARLAAGSGVDIGVQMIAEDDEWRSTLGAGVWVDAMRVSDDTTLSISVSDEVDGVISNDKREDITLVAEGRVNSAVQRIEVVLSPILGSYESMAASVYAKGVLDIEAESIEAESFLASATAVYDDGDEIGSFGPTELEGSSGDIYAGPLDLETPDEALALAIFRDLATEISIDDLRGKKIENVVLTEKSNKFGPVNERGIYLIECGGQKIVIRDSMIRGTLILVNPKPDSEMKEGMHWEPLLPNDPTLVVFGSCKFDLSGDDVDVGKITGEYIHADDQEWMDNHADSTLSGFMYVGGDLLVQNAFRFTGALVAAGDVVLEDDIDISAGPNYAREEVTGFIDTDGVRVKQGSIRRLVR